MGLCNSKKNFRKFVTKFIRQLWLPFWSFCAAYQSHSSLCFFKSSTKIAQNSYPNLLNLLFHHYYKEKVGQ